MVGVERMNGGWRMNGDGDERRTENEWWVVANGGQRMNDGW